MWPKKLRFHLTFWAGMALLLAGATRSRAFQAIPDPDKIVHEASWNELHSIGPGQPFRYRLSKEGPKGGTVKEIVETKDGDVARLVAKNGAPLTPEEDQAELHRLDNLLTHPELQAHRHQKEKEDSARGDEMVKMLPDAFLYTYEGMVQGASGPCYRLSFKPNPAFTPPDREGEVFHGMVGELWVDEAQLRITRIDAHLISDVNFGWGVLGKLYKGGSFLVEQADVGLPYQMHHWEQTLVDLKLHGTVLLVKSVDFSSVQRFSDFQPVPPETTYQDAIQMLKKSPGTQAALTPQAVEKLAF